MSDHTVSYGSAGFSRRKLLTTSAAVAGVAALGLSPKLLSKAYAGEELNLTIIQPHAIAGEWLKKQFLEKAGVTLNFTVIPYDQVQAQATLDVQSGANHFDVHDYWYATIGALADDKVVVDITDLIEKDKATIKPEDFIKSIYDPYSLVNGKRFGLPYDGDTHVLFFNTEILARNGLSAPKTWDEYNAAAAKITEKEKSNGVYGAALLGFKVPVILVSTYANRLAGYGGQFLKDGKPDLLSDQAVAAAEELLRVAPHALPTPAETAFDQALRPSSPARLPSLNSGPISACAPRILPTRRLSANGCLDPAGRRFQHETGCRAQCRFRLGHLDGIEEEGSGLGVREMGDRPRRPGRPC